MSKKIYANLSELLPDLRALLAELYGDEASIRRILADSGIDASHILFGSSTNTWHAVLTEAEKNDQVKTLFAMVKSDYGTCEEFRNFCEEYNRLIKERIHSFTSDTVVFDFSHDQKEWRPSPSLGAGYRGIKGIATRLGWNVVSKDDAGWLTNPIPQSLGALVLICPRHRELEQGEIDKIRDYVSNGGGLLVLGYFCISHHRTNLNDLMNSLGGAIRFKDDVVLPKFPRWPTHVIDPNYVVRVNSSNTDIKSISDAILKKVNTIGLYSSCSLDVKPRDERVVLHTGQQQLVWEPQDTIPSSDNSRYWDRITDYALNREKRCPLVAVTTFDAGKIAVIGSWTVFHDEMIAQTPDNGQLFENLLTWFKICNKSSFTLQAEAHSTLALAHVNNRSGSGST